MGAFKIPDETHICQLHLRTSNLERSIRFYLGLPCFRMIESAGRHAALAIGDDSRSQIILTCNLNACRQQENHTGKAPVFAIRFFSVKHLAEIYGCIKDAGLPIHGLIHRDDYLFFTLNSPDDKVVGFFADMSRSACRQAGEEPLNAAKIIERQNVHPDHPAEMDIGCIGLHVRDLEEARYFFGNFLGLAVTRADEDGFSLSVGSHQQLVAVSKRSQYPYSVGIDSGLIAYRLRVPYMQTVYELQKRTRLFGYEEKISCFAPGILCMSDPAGCMLEIHSSDFGSYVKERASNL